MVPSTPPSSRLDRFLPAYDFNEVHETVVRASADETWSALTALRSSEVPLVAVLMGLRRLPARIFGRRVPYLAGADDAPVLESIARSGFFTLDSEPGREIVVGIVGQFWTLSPEPVRLSAAEDFTGFSRPGFARAVMNFEILAEGPVVTRLRTETRIHCTDARSRRTFGLYWTFVHPGSALIRRVWLRAVRKRAEARRG